MSKIFYIVLALAGEANAQNYSLLEDSEVSRVAVPYYVEKRTCDREGRENCYAWSTRFDDVSVLLDLWNRNQIGTQKVYAYDIAGINNLGISSFNLCAMIHTATTGLKQSINLSPYGISETIRENSTTTICKLEEVKENSIKLYVSRSSLYGAAPGKPRIIGSSNSRLGISCRQDYEFRWICGITKIIVHREGVTKDNQSLNSISYGFNVTSEQAVTKMLREVEKYLSDLDWKLN